MRAGETNGVRPAPFGCKGESLTSVCRLARILPPCLSTCLPARLPNGLYTCFDGASSFPLLRGSRSLHSSLLPYRPPRSASVLLSLDLPPPPLFRALFFVSRLRLPPRSSRPSHVRGNPANFVEFPRNELKETGAAGRKDGRDSGEL